MRQLEDVREQFERSTGSLGEELSGYMPAAGMMTVAQQVAHAAQVVDWLVAGAASGGEFDLEFASQIARVMAVESLGLAKTWFQRAMAGAIAFIAQRTEAELAQCFPPGPILGGMPAYAIVTAIAEHTSHHRGALAVYARIEGIRPPDPYGL